MMNRRCPACKAKRLPRLFLVFQKQVACRADIDAMSQAFTTAEAERRAAVAAWAAEVAEFNARGSASSSTGNHREHGGTLTRPDHQ